MHPNNDVKIIRFLTSSSKTLDGHQSSYSLVNIDKLFVLTAASECHCLLQLSFFWQLWEQIKKKDAGAVGAK